MDQGTEIDPRQPRKKHRLLLWSIIALFAVALVLVIAFQMLVHRIEPILRARVVQTLSARFNSRVELGSLDVSVVRGFEVSGADLAIYPNDLETSNPTLSVTKFSFRTAYTNLLRSPMTIGHVDVQGLHINLPSKSQRKQISGMNGGNPGGDASHIKIVVEEIRASDAVLTLGTDKPGKVPLKFHIHHLILKSVGTGQPLSFQATLVNPKPVGNIQSSGSFGPWNAADPGSTPISGNYSFRDANLGTLKGIRGILSSTGHYDGILDKIVIDGQTDTPDFQLDVSGHKVPLHTDFHAIVDGMNGDTYLQPVVAHLLNSAFTANGYVVRTPGIPGHHIYLDVNMDQAHIQDLLQLAVRADPPVLNGQVKMHAKVDLPPGKQDVADRIKLQGNFQILNAHFTNQKVQSGVDQLSLRGQGEPSMAKQEAKNTQTANVSSQMMGNFTLDNGSLSVSNLNYDVPGANINLDGVYTLDGRKFDFFGTANLKATVSQMVGGWKGLLLSPVDKFFQKNGAGTQVPIKITGTKSDLHFGLDFHHDDDLEKKLQGRQPAK